MNGPTNNPVNDTDLTNTLHRRADDFARLGGSDLDLAQVVSRAGEIRRGRRMRASMMMAAVVVAVAVPIGITVIGSDSPKRSHQPPIATNSPKPTPSPTTDPDPIGIGDLDIGDTTEAGLAYGTKIVLPDRSLNLGSGGELRAIAWVGSSFLVARDEGNGTQRVSSIGIDGNGGTALTWSYSGSGFAVSPARDIGAFVEADGTVRVVQDSGTRNYSLGKLPADSYVVDAVTGENCSGRADIGDATCDVYLHSTGEHPAIWEASPNAAPRKMTEPEFAGFRKLTGISAHNAIAGMTSASDSGSCWEVRKSDGQTWSTCKYSLLSFSGDGRYVLAGGAYQSGAGDSTFAVLDADTGAVVLDLKTATDAFIAERVWEDGNNVIASVYDHGKWAVERINVTTGGRQFAGALAPGGTDGGDNGELILTDDGSMVSPFKLAASR